MSDWFKAIVEALSTAVSAGVNAWSATREQQRQKSAPPPADRAGDIDTRIDAERAAAKKRAAEGT